MWRRIGLLSSLTLTLMTPAHANIAGVSVNNTAIIVQDGTPRDLDPAANAVEFTFNIAPAGAGYRAQGTVRAITVPGVSASTILTEAVIENLAGGPDPAAGTVIVTHFFPGIGPAASNNASLAGGYDDVSGVGFIDSADIDFAPFYESGAPAVSVFIGAINPQGVAGVAPPVPFGGASGPVRELVAPVNSHLGTITIDLGLIGDAISLPDSAEIHTRLLTTPEIPTLTEWGFLILVFLLLFAGPWLIREKATIE